jgi:hypothetical protein
MVEKIWGFMAKIVHRAISYMRSLGLNKQLEYMWCSSSTKLGDRLALDEVFFFQLILLALFCLCCTFHSICHIVCHNGCSHNPMSQKGHQTANKNSQKLINIYVWLSKAMEIMATYFFFIRLNVKEFKPKINLMKI